MESKVVPDVKLVSPSCKLLSDHVKGCKNPQTCGECAWSTKGNFWRTTFKWLRAGYAGKTGSLTIGCQICALEAAKFVHLGGDSSALSAYARFEVKPQVSWKMSRFRHHEKSQYHIAAQAGDTSCHAPCAKEFEELAHKMRRGQSEREQGNGTPSRRSKLMRYCLSESILHAYRAFLSTATSITLMRDES